MDISINFLIELTRRNVFKVASVYLLITWLALQMITVISPSLNLPAMFSNLATVILFLGFPVTCVIAWALELTPDGINLLKMLKTNTLFVMKHDQSSMLL